ncbi:Os04g0540500 [Oryza sativa Japonica Group]|uniref:Os04g0540500 protein n=2 Tax=Oryza sativa subsp. japonica TaxID=39947 RepID=Q0JBD2_ORYSJ|nr:hypothetical protein EE612_024668 [Oryza sativa]BAF15355.1 Os04g0540500 [Oryza sativa Japonica Group]BAS90290.1 Os04g0540500 [Oryza sativa Japonica Group]|eukprot:NP_001053441.1 Os04g0540500 [Oryza sativa Japonica Group]
MLGKVGRRCHIQRISLAMFFWQTSMVLIRRRGYFPRGAFFTHKLSSVSIVLNDAPTWLMVYTMCVSYFLMMPSKSGMASCQFPCVFLILL